MERGSVSTSMRDDFVERCADRLRSAGYRYPDEMAQSLVRAGLSAETSAGGLATEEEWARAMDQVLNSKMVMWPTRGLCS